VDVRALRDLVASRFDAYREALEQMVNVDCGSYTPEGVNVIADLCERRLRDDGWDVDRRPHAPEGTIPQLGDLVIGVLHGSGGPRVLVVGHMDTVFDPGTAAARPFRIDGARATGPGVSDMKGGLLAGFVATEALQAAALDGFGRITFVCNPDEEIGSPFSGPVIADLARQHDVAFVLESARANGDIVSARKGITDYEIRYLGRAAHAGVEPEKGRSAVLQAARTTVALHELHDRWPGVTVNVGVARGGTRSNVVPERAELHVDVRSPELASLEEAEREVERIASETTVPDVVVELHANRWHRPMQKSEQVERLLGRAASIAAELGFELRNAATGGASDANTIAAAGTPVLDGLGPIGGDDHAPGEWLDLSSVVPRTTLLAALIALP
jgi:glutamate carboxypeptidase